MYGIEGLSFEIRLQDEWNTSRNLLHICLRMQTLANVIF